LAFVAFTVKI
jgi:hypothetical protein